MSLHPPSEEDFRALARSAPWLFMTLHFTHRRATRQGSTEAWLSRPGRLAVREASGERHVVTGLPYAKGTYGVGDAAEPPSVLPHETDPPRRPDGLVAERPDQFEVDYDDPLWGSYDWVAMLDPVELSHGTTITDLAATERKGRLTWWASMTAVAGYEPRCSCCPLLAGAESDRLLNEEGGSFTLDSRDLPDSWVVGLDRRTGIVVSSEPIGGNRPDLGFSVDIHAVDEPIDEMLFVVEPPSRFHRRQH